MKKVIFYVTSKNNQTGQILPMLEKNHFPVSYMPLHFSIDDVQAFVKEWLLFLQETSMHNNQNRYEQALQKGEFLQSILFKSFDFQIPKNALILFVTESTFNDIPFEILPYQGKMLCEVFPIIRQMHIPVNTLKLYSRKTTNGYDGLLLKNMQNPSLWKSIEREAKQMKKAKNIKWKVISTQAFIAPNRFKELLYKVSFFHYAGYGTEPFLPLGSQKIDAEEIARLDLSHIKMAFINSCHSANHSDTSLSLLEAFAQAGVQQYAGFASEVPTKYAEETAIYFWKNIHLPFPMLMLRLRKHLISLFGKQNLHFTALRFYGIQEVKPNMKIMKPKKRRLRKFFLWMFVLGLLGQMLEEKKTDKKDITKKEVKVRNPTRKPTQWKKKQRKQSIKKNKVNLKKKQDLKEIVFKEEP
ncbi:MAG: CHAT domain-containing protein [Candidatus Hydrogenedentota bacterium]|nr:MAG: CHAT domain-containing protein [Candidatus Hydrogenedentota bacterium]